MLRREGRELEVVVNGNSSAVLERLQSFSPESLKSEALTLEEIFVTALRQEGAPA
ncbi:MAG: hypothetical protein M5U12_10140 [Verrucomicrobia bacterium]|nr:hypothetical protein [Verrucomicrobiota bacterium]